MALGWSCELRRRATERGKKWVGDVPLIIGCHLYWVGDVPLIILIIGCHLFGWVPPVWVPPVLPPVLAATCLGTTCLAGGKEQMLPG